MNISISALKPDLHSHLPADSQRLWSLLNSSVVVSTSLKIASQDLPKTVVGGGVAGNEISFGPFKLFPEERLLLEADTPVRIGSRAFDILVAMVKRPSQLISKDELMAQVWPNLHVEPANLTVHIAALRRLLGDGCNGNRYVINIPGRGYRFVAIVSDGKKLNLPTESLNASGDMSDEPLSWKIEALRGELVSLWSAVRQLQLSDLDSASAQLLISRKSAELEDLINQVKRTW